MACGGCGGGAKRSQVIPQQTSGRGIPMTQPVRAVNQGPKQQIAPQAHFNGVRAQVQRRCGKCSWPMNSMRRFDAGTSRQIQIWVCMNRKCMHREES